MPLFPLPCNAALSSGQVGSGFIASGAVQGFFGSTRNIASGTVGVFDFGSGAVIAGTVGSGAIVSGNIGSGQVGQFHIASGAITSGLIGVTGAAPDGTRFLRDDFTWTPVSAAVNSGDIGSGKIASGAVQGFFGSTRDIASGTVGVFDLGSGAIIAGTVGSGAIVSGNIASGQIGSDHLGSGAVLSGAIGSGQVGQFAIASGAVTSGRIGVTGAAPDGTRFLRDDFTWVVPTTTIASGAIGSGLIASGAVQGFFGTTRNIASGTVGVFDLGSGAVVAGTVGSGAIVSGNIASGQVGNRAIASGAIQSGHIASGNSIAGPRFPNLALWEIAALPAAPASGLLQQYVIDQHGFPTMHLVDPTGAPWEVLRDNLVLVRNSTGAPITKGQAVECQGATGNVANVVLIQANAAAPITAAGLAAEDIANNAFGRVMIAGQLESFDTSAFLAGDDLWVSTSVAGGLQNTRPTYPNQAIFIGVVEVSGVGNGTVLVIPTSVNANASSGSVLSGVITSGAVQGFFGSVRNIASGTIGVFDFGSGAVVAGTVGSGAVVSGNIASGQIGANHLGSGAVLSGAIASGQVGQFAVASGSITSGRLGVTGAPDGTKFLRDDFTWSNPSSSGDVASGDIASGAVQGFFGTTRNIASGTVGVFDLGSGAVVANTVGSGAIVSGNIASGQIGPNHLGSGAVTSGAIASGQVSQFALSSGAVNSGHTASGAVITYARDIISDLFTCTETISGVRCVTFDPVGSGQIRLAMAAVSGRMPAIGVVFENQLSGDICKVVSLGHVIPPTTAMGSGVCISGRIGKSLWVGASGQLVVLSGGGPTIGVGATNSGAYGQRMGVSAMSGTVLVQLNPNMQFSGSANVTTNLQQWPV